MNIPLLFANNNAIRISVFSDHKSLFTNFCCSVSKNEVIEINQVFFSSGELGW